MLPLQPKTLLIFPHGLHGVSFSGILKVALEHFLEVSDSFPVEGFEISPHFEGKTGKKVKHL